MRIHFLKQYGKEPIELNDLRGAYLRSAYLSGADLRGADLRGANLSGADLRRADLRDANLSRASMSGADLRGAAGVLNFYGGRHTAYATSAGIQIGCMWNYTGWWLENYRHIGKENGYTPQEIEMYGNFIKACVAKFVFGIK